MTPGEFKKIVQTMDEYCISHVKMGDVEIDRPCLSSLTVKKGKALPVPDEDLEKEEDPIKHKVEQMTSLMKLSDTELVDQLFPDHTETDEIA